MNYKRNLMTGLIGLALLAAPITAAAKDNDSGKNNSNQARSESRHDAARSYSESAPRSNGPERNVAPSNAPRNEFRDQRGGRNENRNFAPAPVTHDETRDQHNTGTWVNAPEGVTNRDAREDRKETRRDRREDRNDGDRWNHDRDRDRDYRNYGFRDYDDYALGAPYYVMPRGYAGGACAWARHLRNVYYYDRNTGHPAAANDLLPQLRRAERNCGGVPYGYGYYR